MRVLKLRAEPALVKVLQEFKMFLSRDVDEENADPLNVTSELEGLVQEPNSEITEMDFTETFRFYKAVREKLVYIFPMQTTHKCKYSSGTHLRHLRAREAPEPKDFWVSNTDRLTNIVSGQLLEGTFTPDEENVFLQFEKHAMIHPASFQADQRNHQIKDFMSRGMYIWHPPPSESESSDEFDFDMDDYEYDWDREVSTLGEQANQARPQVIIYKFIIKTVIIIYNS